MSPSRDRGRHDLWRASTAFESSLSLAWRNQRLAGPASFVLASRKKTDRSKEDTGAEARQDMDRYRRAICIPGTGVRNPVQE
eukprot:1033457-Rhodomonas_salina.1